MEKIIKLIREERLRQDEKWGIQNHDLGYWYAILGEEFGEIGKALCEIFYQDNNGATVRLSYTMENLKKEIIQTAAVCIAWLECNERFEKSRVYRKEG